MFIKMRRFKQEMTKEECEKVLRKSTKRSSFFKY